MTASNLASSLAESEADAASTAAASAIQRLSGLSGDRIRVEIQPDRTDRYLAQVTGGILRITASSARAAISAYAAYVRRTGEAHVSRFGTRPVEGHLADGDPIEGKAAVQHRVAYNITVGGYTTPFYDWEQWEAELDLLAASGITAAHITLGQELVWLRTFTQFGYTEKEVLAWIVPPSHQPWQWLNNIQSFGEGTTLATIRQRADLANRVIVRMRELGITAILPGFSGTVPPGFADRNADAFTVPQGKWFMDVVGPERPDWLSSTTPAYASVARAFYAEQTAAFGRAGAWAVDLLHEGGKTGPFSVTDAARGVERALAEANPDYVWIIQAWAGNPRRELLDAIDLSHVLVLDLTGEAVDTLGGYQGADWALGILPNYGGRTVLYGDLQSIASLPSRWADGRDIALRGLTNMAEGLANNPVVWDLFSDLAWTDKPIDLDAWLATWLRSRYGTENPHALTAWHHLLSNVYGPWRHPHAAGLPAETAAVMQGEAVDAAAMSDEMLGLDASLGSEGVEEFAAFGFYASTDSVIAAIPSVNANQASTVGPRALGYPADALLPAVEKLLEAAADIRTPGFSYDLVDISRQLADDTARIAVESIAVAAKARDLAAYDRAVDDFLALIDALERTLQTHDAFLLGAWESDARRWGDDPIESEYLASEARRLLTCWGYADSIMLTEYATRSWAGLVGDYYRSRWSTWLREVRKTLGGEASTPVDWYEFADQWVRTSPAHSAEPSGDARDAVTEMVRLVESLTRGSAR